MRVHVVAVILAVTGVSGYASGLAFSEPVAIVQDVADPLAHTVREDALAPPAPAPPAPSLAAAQAARASLPEVAPSVVLAAVRETLERLPVLFLLPGGDLQIPTSAVDGGAAGSAADYLPVRPAQEAPTIPFSDPALAAPADRADGAARDELSSPWAPSASTRAFAPPTRSGGSVEAAARTGLAVGALALLGFALYHRIRPHSALENETRKTIFDAVCAQPGLGVHEVARVARVSYSTATYHLERLVAAGMLVMTPDGNKLCYYKNGGAFTESERKILPLVKNDEAVRLFEAILESPGTYRAALAERLGVTATTINWHLRRLRDAGLVDEIRAGRSAYLTARSAAMRESFTSLALKVGESDPIVAARLRKYAGDVVRDTGASA